jgi:ABC-type transporter MlaC component
MPQAAAAKLDQIKDLYLTAEAIGEDGVGKHFDQLSQRQRELIKDYFEQSKQNGAS